MKRNHVVICSHLLAVGNEILSYVGSFNISAYDDGVKTTANNSGKQLKNQPFGCKCSIIRSSGTKVGNFQEMVQFILLLALAFLSFCYYFHI